MITYLHPGYFIAAVFISRPTTDSLKFSELRNIRDSLTKNLSTYGIAIEWTRDSVMSDLRAFPEVFDIHDEYVSWKTGQDRTWKSIHHMNYNECVINDKLTKSLEKELTG